MKVKQIEKKSLLEYKDLIRLQIVLQLVFFKRESIIPFDIDLLTLLALYGEIELGKFCSSSTKDIYKVIEAEEFAIKSQNIRNRINKLVKRGFISKKGTGKKTISLNESISIHRESSMLLNYKFVGFENKA